MEQGRYVLTFELGYAFVLLPVPLLVYRLLPAYRDRSDAVRAPFFARLVELTGSDPSPGAAVVIKNRLQRGMVFTSWLLLVSALADPVWVGDAVTREVAARDLLLVVDLSGSMEEADFTNDVGERVSRLDAVKTVLDDFVDRREGDRLALAVFGSGVFPQASFTEDRAVIKELVHELQPRMAGPQTMIGDAIGLAVRLFEGSERQSKVAIMLTDGNDTGSKMPVARAATIAAANDIVIHTIAMGDPQTVGEQALDLATLESIAAVTSGRFFVALDRGELGEIYDVLDQLEPVLLETLSYRPRRALYYVPLGLVLVLGALMGLVMTYGRVPSLRTQHV